MTTLPALPTSLREELDSLRMPPHIESYVNIWVQKGEVAIGTVTDLDTKKLSVLYVNLMNKGETCTDTQEAAELMRRANFVLQIMLGRIRSSLTPEETARLNEVSPHGYLGVRRNWRIVAVPNLPVKFI